MSSRSCQIIHDESIFAGSIVPLLIGQSICPISIHFRLLSARSPFFARLLVDWSESDKETVLLPEVAPDVFEQFLGWLYTDHLDLRRKNGGWGQLCRLWVMADRFEVPTLQNCVVETFSARLYQNDVTGLDLKVLEYVYSETGPQSLLRKLFVHVSVWYGKEDGFADLTNELPPEFHTDYAVQRARKTRQEDHGRNPWDLTQFLVQERTEAGEELRGDVPKKTDNKPRKDSVTEDWRSERKRTRKT